MVKTAIVGWTEYNRSTCASISAGSFTTLTQPTHGKLFFSVENSTLSNGECPGIVFPFSVVRYTWTDKKQQVLADPFTVQWTTPDAMFSETSDITAELAKIAQAQSIWWACSATTTALPSAGTLTLTNPPPTATSFVWTISSGGGNLSFSNGTTTITTPANNAGIKSIAASTAKNDVGVNVAAKGLSYFYKTDVRTPKTLKRRPDLDADNGRGASCAVSGTDGWQSLVGYEIDDQFKVITSKPDNADAGINEQLGPKKNFQPNNWTFGEGGSSTPSGTFSDNLCVTTNAFLPNPLPPQTPLTKTLVDQIRQAWYAGSPATPQPNQGCKVQTNQLVRYIDHGRHAGIKSPPTLSTAEEASGSAGDVSSSPMPVADARRMADRADAVVKGSVVAVTDSGAADEATRGTSARWQKALVLVDGVLKGSVDAETIAVYFPADDRVPAMRLASNDYALLFLIKDARGGFRFVDRQIGKLPITRRSVSLARTPDAAAQNLEAELFASLSDGDPEVARAALEQVATLGAVSSTQDIRDIATGGAADRQGLAYLALIRLGDYALFDQAAAFAARPTQDQGLQRTQFGILEAIGDIDDRAVLPALHPMLASSSADMRRAAAKALRTMADPASARFLAAALDDSDREVQYDAVMALATLADAGPAHAPAQDVFAKAPATYLVYWKTWWKTTGRQKYAATP